MLVGTWLAPMLGKAWTFIRKLVDCQAPQGRLSRLFFHAELGRQPVPGFLTLNHFLIYSHPEYLVKGLANHISPFRVSKVK